MYVHVHVYCVLCRSCFMVSSPLKLYLICVYKHYIYSVNYIEGDVAKKHLPAVLDRLLGMGRRNRALV